MAVEDTDQKLEIVDVTVDLSAALQLKADLARRLVACKHFRWMQGMTANHNGVCVEGSDPGDLDDGEMGLVRWTSGHWKCTDYQEPDPDDLPDLTDPATLGCLLALVLEAYGDEDLGCHPMCEPFRGWEWYSRDKSMTAPPGGQSTYPEALVAALEAAP